MPLYPLKFHPRFLPKIWGGRRLQEVLDKPLPHEVSVGESWELYDFPAGVVEKSTDWVSSVVSNGPLAGRTLHSLVEEFGAALHGDVPLSGKDGQFPVLIKFLDARQDLSVQVHPDARYAALNADCHLKSEAWYVMEHEPDAAIYKGLKPGTQKEQFKSAIAAGTVMNHVVRVPVKVGDCHYLPSGTIHALGAGVLVAEVQTPSDTTFRVFDFNRIDESTGKPRKLHVEEAMECIDFSVASESSLPRNDPIAPSTSLVSCPYFQIDKMHFPGNVEQRIQNDQPVVWIMLEGEALVEMDQSIETVQIRRGETVLLPAKMEGAILKTGKDCTWLAVTFPTGK